MQDWHWPKSPDMFISKKTISIKSGRNWGNVVQKKKCRLGDHQAKTLGILEGRGSIPCGGNLIDLAFPVHVSVTHYDTLWHYRACCSPWGGRSCQSPCPPPSLCPPGHCPCAPGARARAHTRGQARDRGLARSGQWADSRCGAACPPEPASQTSQDASLSLTQPQRHHKTLLNH